MTKHPTIYLAGAIRDDKPQDILWREKFISTLWHDASFLNPLGGKKRDANGVWRMSDRIASAKRIVAQDEWCVRRADIIIANFSSMADGYPSIGTVAELGIAVGVGGKLIYGIANSSTTFGVENTKNFKMHPFITELCSDVFENEDECLAFLTNHLRVLNGEMPNCLEDTGHALHHTR